jgi:hypothetical protein
MSDISYNIPLITPRQYAVLAIVGLATVAIAGVCTCVILVFALMWAVVNVGLLVIQSFIEVMHTIGILYTQSDSLIKVLLLAAIAFCIYRICTCRKGR